MKCNYIRTKPLPDTLTSILSITFLADGNVIFKPRCKELLPEILMSLILNENTAELHRTEIHPSALEEKDSLVQNFEKKIAEKFKDAE